MSPQATVRRRRLGRELQRLRENAGLSLEGTAELLRENGGRWSRARINRIEHASVSRLTERDLHALLDVYGLEERDPLVTLAKRADEPGWWDAYEDVLTDSYVAFEAEATEIREFSPLVVPGLLQTARYAAALFRTEQPPPSEDEIDRLVAARRTRSVIFDRQDPPRLWAIIDEAALLRPIGGADVMREQLGYLLAINERTPHIHLHVLPLRAGAHAGLTGGFSLLQFRDAQPLVHAETGTGNLLSEKSDMASRCREQFAHLLSSALGDVESAQLIESIKF